MPKDMSKLARDPHRRAVMQRLVDDIAESNMALMVTPRISTEHVMSQLTARRAAQLTRRGAGNNTSRINDLMREAIVGSRESSQGAAADLLKESSWIDVGDDGGDEETASAACACSTA